MALKQVMIAKKLRDLRAALAEQEKREKELSELRDALKKREAQLEEAVNEAATEEEQKAVEEEAAAYETDEKAQGEAESACAQRKDEIMREIGELERELEELNNRDKETTKDKAVRKEGKEKMEIRNNVHMNWRERVAEACKREEGKAFVQRVRDLGRQNRAITGAELTIPDVFLGMIREATAEASKLMKHVYLRRVSGTGRVNVMGAIPEAVWTEMCATLNELSLSFTNVEVDGYKVGGFIAVCNAILEDSDVNLASEIIYAIGRAIGLALDKAIIYGTGTKMPLGIVTRLAQTAQPESYSATKRAWADLHESNLIAITSANATGIKLFQALAKAAANAKNEYSSGGLFWAMNEKTKLELTVQAMSFNANGAIVTGQQNTMPIVGGAIETLAFMPDNMIVGGYGGLYLLVERAGTQMARSEHVLFLEDNTVFKGTARYDGVPVIPEGFVGIGIAGTAPAANDVSFAADVANAS